MQCCNFYNAFECELWKEKKIERKKVSCSLTQPEQWTNLLDLRYFLLLLCDWIT